MRLKNLLLEAEYTHVGYGKYKEKGKEKDPKAQTFKKTDQGKYVPIKSDEPTSGKDSKKDTPKVNIFDKPKKSDKKEKSDTPKVSSSKLTKLMPKADKETFTGQSDINKIPDSQKKEISMQIDKLAELAKQAKEKGEAAPNFNLCKITVPGTNLYCEGNAGIPREEMPQFKGKPTPGSPASKMAVDASGEVDTEPVFKKMLKEKGIKTVETEIPSDRLKATQSELVGAKVAGMSKALEKDPNHPAITAPIYVSRDGYVIDGHHRWAAVTSAAIADGKPANMKVIVIDMDIKDAIPMANKFAEEIGVAAKKADANQEGPKKDEPKSSKPDRYGDDFEVGRPVVYKDGDKEYSGEVVMNPKNQTLVINGKPTFVGMGTVKGIQTYGSDTFIVPDDWNDAKSFDDSMDEPKSQPKQQRKGNPAVNKEVKGLAEKEGFTPSQLGKEEYKTKMMQAAVSALTDANFHDEARELVAKLEGKPEWAKKPEYPSMDDPEYDEKIKAIRTNSSEASKFMQPDSKTWSFGRQIAQKAGWDGVDAVDGLAFTLRMNGFHKEADAIQSVVQESKSTRLTSILKEASEDDKYTHIGYGRYKEKGKEKDANAPTFKKDDSGKYTPTDSKPSGGGNEPKKPAGAAIKGSNMFKHAPDVKQQAPTNAKPAMGTKVMGPPPTNAKPAMGTKVTGPAPTNAKPPVGTKVMGPPPTGAKPPVGTKVSAPAVKLPPPAAPKGATPPSGVKVGAPAPKLPLGVRPKGAVPPPPPPPPPSGKPAPKLPPGVKAKPPVVAPPSAPKAPLGPPPGVKAKPPVVAPPSGKSVGTPPGVRPKGAVPPPPPPPPSGKPSLKTPAPITSKGGAWEEPDWIKNAPSGWDSSKAVAPNSKWDTKPSVKVPPTVAPKAAAPARKLPPPPPPPIPKSGSAPGVRPRPAGSIPPPPPPPPPTQNRDRESDADKSKKGSLGSRFRSLINKFK
jgi:hypothetical protein